MAITLTQLNTFLAVVKGGSVTAAASQTGAASSLVLAAAESVAGNTAVLRQEADRFVAEIRAA